MFGQVLNNGFYECLFGHISLKTVYNGYMMIENEQLIFVEKREPKGSQNYSSFDQRSFK